MKILYICKVFISNNSTILFRVKFKSTLSTIGAFGRECLDYSLPTLIQLLENRISRLHGQIQRISSQGGTEVDSVLADLFEDVHWILLVAGNVLALQVKFSIKIQITCIPPVIDLKNSMLLC